MSVISLLETYHLSILIRFPRDEYCFCSPFFRIFFPILIVLDDFCWIIPKSVRIGTSKLLMNGDYTYQKIVCRMLEWLHDISCFVRPRSTCSKLWFPPISYEWRLLLSTLKHLFNELFQLKWLGLGGGGDDNLSFSGVYSHVCKYLFFSDKI